MAAFPPFILQRMRKEKCQIFCFLPDRLVYSNILDAHKHLWCHCCLCSAPSEGFSRWNPVWVLFPAFLQRATHQSFKGVWACMILLLITYLLFPATCCFQVRLVRLEKLSPSASKENLFVYRVWSVPRGGDWCNSLISALWPSVLQYIHVKAHADKCRKLWISLQGLICGCIQNG